MSRHRQPFTIRMLLAVSLECDRQHLGSRGARQLRKCCCMLHEDLLVLDHPVSIGGPSHPAASDADPVLHLLQVISWCSRWLHMRRER